LKWTGAVLCVVILGVWGVSGWLSISWIAERVGIGVKRGEMWCVKFHRFHTESERLESLRLRDEYGSWGCSRIAFDIDRVGLTMPRLETIDASGDYRGHWLAEFPLWLHFILVALPTAFMFYRDRKLIPPGHCTMCGYNLTGAEHERCPECGVACQADAEADG